jgi:7-carboxy-7-deazaguanine synthase
MRWRSVSEPEDHSLKKLRLLELYYSVQGEGPRVGRPTIFVRFAGCNLKCASWPCDTPNAIDPLLYKQEQELFTCGDVAEQVLTKSLETGARNVCITGGEPMLQHTLTMQHFIEDLVSRGLVVEMFSNGTIAYTEQIAANCHITMDWKLPGSGEDFTDATRIENLRLLRESRRDHAVKFTIADVHDLATAYNIWGGHLRTGIVIPVYAGPVWGKFDPDAIVEFMQENKLPWMVTLQVHKYIWDPQARFV